MENRRKIVIVVMILAVFIFAVSFSTLYAQMQISAGTTCSCSMPIPLLIPVLSSIGVLIGSAVYYFMFPKVEESKEKQGHIVTAMLDMLYPDEKEIVKKLLENKGKISQSKLSSLFGKVKTFRVLENLKKRGIIEKEPYGKTNTIILSEKFRQSIV